MGLAGCIIPTCMISSTEWENFLKNQGGHLLQSWAWGELKNQFGWTPLRVQVEDAAAQILFRRLPLGQTIAYIPKGPIVNWRDTRQCEALFAVIHAEAKQHNAIFLKIEPNLVCGSEQQISAMADFMKSAAFTPADAIQPQTSIVLDISGDEESILAAMKQKTRYNIRLAERKGVVVRQGAQADIATFYNLARQTATRDDFGIHSLAYYQTAHRLFAPQQCALLLAEYDNQPLAGLMVFCQGEHAYYFYGASSNQHRNLMAPYLIQWEAVRWAKSRGCTRYDLWGIPNVNIDTLETQFAQRSDGLWGVYRFKRGFGGQIVKSAGALDYVYKPPLYRLYKLYRQRGL